MRKLARCSAAITVSLLTAQAHAALILNTGITSTFTDDTTGTNTQYNDWSAAPDGLYFGQLQANANGVVDFYYIGNEAGYTNTLLLNRFSSAADVTHSTAGLPDNFNSSLHVGSVNVLKDGFVDFGFCTSGGANVGASGGCAYNADATSLTDQFNYGGLTGYRSIGYRPLSGNVWADNLGDFAAWGLFWDDSGASNDDNHDDYIAIARFKPVSVPEPATSVLLGAGLLGLALTRRRRTRQA